MRICQERKFADHILAEYHLKGENNSIKQGCTSNKQHFGDQEVLQAIKKYWGINVAVFIDREYGGFPLIDMYFEIL